MTSFPPISPRFPAVPPTGLALGNASVEENAPAGTVVGTLSAYDEALSRELTELTVTANLKMRELGFKPYVAPALSSGALSLLLTLRGAWHCGSVFLDGVYLGCKNRLTPWGVETELLPQIPDALYAHIEAAAAILKEIV